MPQTPDEFMKIYEDVATAHDLARTLHLIADDAVYFFSNETQHIGKAAIAEAIRKNFEVIKCETYQIRNLTWLVHTESTATGVFDYAWSGLVHGESASGGGRGTIALIKRDDRWWIVHEHLSRGRFRSV